MDLPKTIPLFPLPNVLLFPGVPLPLHVFEPRYRQMIREADDFHQFIGMVLLRQEAAPKTDDPPTIFQVGCVGKIVNVEPLPDGRSNVLLHGVREFRVVEEIAGKPYRQAKVEWLRRQPGDLEPAARARLIAVLRDYLRQDEASPAHKVLNDGSLSDEILVNFFSYVLDVPPLEKQALLEEPSLAGRAQRLREVVEFRNAAELAGLDVSDSNRFH